jgi:hypothetical protein
VGTLQFNISSGSYGTDTACLIPGKIYTPYACGGSWHYEVSWSVGGISGGADSSCSGSESFSATWAPTPIPTISIKPTISPTPKPTYAPTSISGVINPYEFNLAASIDNSVLRLDADLKLSRYDGGLLALDVTNIVVDGTGRTLSNSADNDDDYDDLYADNSISSYKGYSFEIIRSDVKINDLTIKGGVFFGGLNNNGSTLTLSQVSFYNCSQGPALNVHDSSTEMSNILFQDNVGSYNTMAVSKGSLLVLKRVQFVSNTKALSVKSTGNNFKPALLTSVEFTHNSEALTVYGSVAALRYAQFEDNHNAMTVYDVDDKLPSSLQLDMVSFARNTGNKYGAVNIEAQSSSTITMTSVTFSKNQAGVSEDDDNSVSSDGAALYISGGSVTASNLVFYDNTPEDTSYSDDDLDCTADCTDGIDAVIATGGKCASCGPCDALRKGFVTMCSPCDAGEYSSRNASSIASCFECGGGNRSFSGANTSCTLDECPVGSYGPLDSPMCEICQGGYATHTAGLTVCSKCQFIEWCPTDGLCAEGHTGVGCAVCELNWYMKSNSCLQCPDTAVAGLALAFLVAALLLIVLYKLAGADEEDEGFDIKGKIEEVESVAATAVAKFNVTLSFFQVTTIVFFSFNIDFPVGLLKWLSWIAFPLSFNIGELGRPECSLGTSMGFASRWSVDTFAPVVLMLPFLILAKCRKESRSQAIATIALIGTTTYVPVVGSAMTVWRCEKTDYGNSVLAAAPSISCDDSGDFNKILAASIIVAALYLCGVHILVPHLSNKEGFGKVKRIYAQDFDKGREWWFHLSVLYKLATLFVAANVPDALAQLACMLVLSSSMASLCFIFKPHIVSNMDNSKKKYWNDKCDEGYRSIWSAWNPYTKRQWTGIQCMICCVFPAIVVTLNSFGQMQFLNMIALLLFLPIFGPLSCAIKCCYEHVFRDGFTPNNVEIVLHTIETFLVLFSFIYEAASKKRPHLNKQLTDEPYDADDNYYYDENGDYISNDQRALDLGLSFIYIFGVALSTFEMARIFNPVQYIDDWMSGESMLELTQQFSEITEKKKTNSTANDVVVVPLNSTPDSDWVEFIEEASSVRKISEASKTNAEVELMMACGTTI